MKQHSPCFTRTKKERKIMAKQKTKADIIQENQELLKKIEDLNAQNKEAAAIVAPDVQDDGGLSRYMHEMQDIRKKGRVEAGTIQVKDFTDHKNISLWTKDGKRIGPMHRHNAEVAFRRFWDLGIKLSATQPTMEQIEEYKKTAEYKAIQAKLAKARAIKNKSRKSGQMDRLAREIAKMSGQTVEAINNVFKSNEIKSLTEGKEMAGVK